MRLKFEPVAADAYTGITDDEVLDRVDNVLDGLEKDPGQARLRRHRWSDPPLWGVTVHCPGEDLLVLWAAETRDAEQVVVIRYIGPEVPRESS